MTDRDIKSLIILNKSRGEILKHFRRVYEVEKSVSAEKPEDLLPGNKPEGVIKNKILLAESRGQVFKPCPGTSEKYICCNYWVLNQSLNCPFNCSYCILQYYLNNPYLTVFTDTEKMIGQIRERMSREPRRFFRIGTGELADSLALNEEGHFAQPLIRFAAYTPNMILELKTKSDRIHSLLHENHKGKTILAWSINPPAVIRAEEHGAASLPRRLKAVELAVKAGYKLAFHFDPILYYPSWKKDYEKTIQHLFNVAPSSRIAWISMGSLRFPPDMKEKILSRFPGTHLLDAEMIRGMDGKLRYFKPLRIRLYQHIFKLLRKYGGPDVFIYFCMEDSETWTAVTGKAPGSNGELDYWFARHLYHHFPGLLSEPPHLEDYLSFSTPRHRDQF
ncbi:MAG: DNA photolyase [Candidatus Marinimicrobia bacterium]|nr:DNA photolyase [Candidatus Neomarinimicrobiota bacterium]